MRGGLFGRRVFAATADKSIYTAEMHVYKVSGRFSFSPDLAMYPFDRKTLSVVIEPKDPSDPFLIQPLSAMAEGRDVLVSGWRFIEGFGELDQEVVASGLNFSGSKETNLLYRFSY